MLMCLQSLLEIKLAFITGAMSIFVSLSQAGALSIPGPDETRYRTVAIEEASDLARLREELGNEEMTLVLKINRRDSRHLRQGMELMVPESFEDPDRYTPFPLHLPMVSDIPKLIFVSRRVQAFAAYEKGVLVRWGPTSTGRKEQPTPATLYHANWKSRLRRSSINPSWLMPWYVNIHTSMGIGLHQYTMPGYPDSHGCIRLLKDDAYWVFYWTDRWKSRDGRTAASYGTPVIVFGEYDYDQPPPWTHLVENPRAATVSSSELEATLDRYLWALLERNQQPEDADEEDRALDSDE